MGTFKFYFFIQEELKNSEIPIIILFLPSLFSRNILNLVYDVTAIIKTNYSNYS